MFIPYLSIDLIQGFKDVNKFILTAIVKYVETQSVSYQQ